MTEWNIQQLEKAVRKAGFEIPYIENLKRGGAVLICRERKNGREKERRK
jgi:hypothetical protein